MDIKWKNYNSGKVAIALTLLFTLAITLVIGGFNNSRYYRQYADMKFHDSEQFRDNMEEIKENIWILGNQGDWKENRNYLEQAEEEKRQYQWELKNTIQDYDIMIGQESDPLAKALLEQKKAQAIASAQAQINSVDLELEREIEKSNQHAVEQAKNELSRWRNVKYIVVNYDENTMFTNTEANSLAEFEEIYKAAASNIGTYPVGIGQLVTNEAYYEAERSNTGQKEVKAKEAEKASASHETVAATEEEQTQSEAEQEVTEVVEENPQVETPVIEQQGITNKVEQEASENLPLFSQLKEEGKQDDCIVALYVPAELVHGDPIYDSWQWHHKQASGATRWEVITVVSFIIMVAIGFIFNKNRALLHQAKGLLIAFSKKNKLEVKAIVVFLGYIYISHLFISYSTRTGLDLICAALTSMALMAYLLEFLSLEDKGQFWNNSYLRDKNIHLRFKRSKDQRQYMINDVQKDWRKKYSLFAVVVVLILVGAWVVTLVGFFGMESNLYDYDQAWYLISDIVLVCLVTSGIAIVAVSVLLALFYRHTKREKVALDHIVEGTERIKQGETDYVLDEEGNHALTTLAYNINNIREGLDVAIANEIKSQKMKTELITNVSHDLKTPLTSIINYANLLQKEELSPEHANQYVEIIVNKSDRLKVLIQDLFEVSKAASGNMEVNLQPIHLQDFLNQVLAETENHFEESQLQLKVTVPQEPVLVVADGAKLWRVIDNLLNNARKYSLAGTRVYLDVVNEEDQVKLSLKNIAGYEMNFDAGEIAERFKRGDEARTTEGSGLGLAIAKSLADLQDIHMNIHIDGDLFKVELEIPTEKQLKVES